MPNSSLSKFLRETRLKKGGKGFWSLRAVAKRASMSHAYLSQLETGQVHQPLPEILKNLANALNQPYDVLLEKAGYLKIQQDAPKTVKIPVLGTVSAGDVSLMIEDDINEWIEINYDVVNDLHSFALKVKGNCLEDIGINQHDIIFVSKTKEVKNGDIAVVRIDLDHCTCKRFFKDDQQIILYPASRNHTTPIVLTPKKNDIEIIGKVIGCYKKF